MLLLQNYYSTLDKPNVYAALRPVGFAVNYGETARWLRAGIASGQVTPSALIFQGKTGAQV
jgi:hypothetical protein